MDHKKDSRRTFCAVDRRQFLLGCAALVCVSLLVMAALLPRDAQAPSAPADADATARLNADCQLIQHLTYVPCGHAVTRRVPLPAELAGQDRAALEAAYDLWEITEYSPSEVTMARQTDLYCPNHTVLMADENGLLCVWQNRYGDAYALTRELALPLTDLPEDTQTQLRLGLAFDDESEVGKYLESIES